MRGQPFCSAHRPGGVPFAGAPLKNVNRQTHGMYRSTIDLGDITPLALTDSLADELIALRAHVARVDDMLLKADTADGIARLFALFLSGIRTIAKILREIKALSPDKADDYNKAIEEVLSAFDSELEVSLVP